MPMWEEVSAHVAGSQRPHGRKSMPTREEVSVLGPVILPRGAHPLLLLSLLFSTMFYASQLLLQFSHVVMAFIHFERPKRRSNAYTPLTYQCNV